MAGTDIADTLLTAGQNEGIDAAVLPPPQLTSVVNMRLRKQSRWGKRFGHTALSTTNLGTGTGLNRAVGGGKGSANTCFALVDDQCSVYDQTAAAFVSQTAIATDSALLRVQGAASGWLPDTSFFPVPLRSLQNQTTTPCASCFAFGYLWTAIQFTNPLLTSDKRIRLVATDPNDQTVVRVDDFLATTTTFGGNSYPRLFLVGSTLVLTYALAIAAGNTTINGRSLASIGAAWSAETLLIAASPYTAYDASAYSATRFNVALCYPGGALVSLFSNALTFVATQAIADVSGNPLTEITVTGTSTVAAGEIYVGYACLATPSTKVRVFTANLAGTVGTGTLSTALARRPLLVLLSAGGVRAVYDENIGTSGVFLFRDVSAAAAAGANAMTQNAAYPVALPFLIGSSVYLWVKTDASQAGYATLLRLPAPSSYAASGIVSCPIELSVQDYVVRNGVDGGGFPTTDLRGVPATTRIGTTASYAVPVPTLYAVGQSIALSHDFRVLQAKHYTDSAQYRSVPALYADSSAFLPMGTLTRVDDRGAVEEGFVHFPAILTIVPAAAAGSLTPLSDYYYTAIYRSRNSNGRFEVSAPATPLRVSMGAGQNQNTVSLLSLGMSARPNTSIEVYRTLANGQTFYLTAVIDSAAGTIVFVDTIADATIATQQALYTQVGQTLANAFPPAARFGCVGGQRIFLGGLMRPDVVQGSKLIFGDQSPSFADNDAFRIVFPSAVTGLAWMDALVIFTVEGIYITSGDGPDDSGVGDFGNITRMPYEVGCIEPRSVIVVDDGCFFQTARGLYMLPRGFGAPIPAGDTVQDTLGLYNIITGTAVLTKATEQSVYWTCTNTASAGAGQRIVYDLAHKSWGVDDSLACGAGQWSGNEVVVFSVIANAAGFYLTNSAYSDPGGAAITMTATTGDLRPFGVLSEGTISKFQVLSNLQSACTMNIQTTTDKGLGTYARVFALAAGDYQIGSQAVTQVDLGNHELRAGMAVRVLISEASTTEAFQLVALSLEHEQKDGLKLVSPLSRAV